LPRAEEHLGDAVFFGTLATGLGLEDNLARTRRAVAEGLALFGVRADNAGPSVADERFFTPAELRLITDLCYQLLLIAADMLAQRVRDEKDDAWHDRLGQALRRLDRADQLQPGRRTFSGLARRAEYLEGLGRKDEARRARKEAEEVAPSLAAD